MSSLKELRWGKEPAPLAEAGRRLAAALLQRASRLLARLASGPGERSGRTSPRTPLRIPRRSGRARRGALRGRPPRRLALRRETAVSARNAAHREVGGAFRRLRRRRRRRRPPVLAAGLSPSGLAAPCVCRHEGPDMTATFIVGRTDLRRTRWQEQPAVPLAEGAVRLRIDRFALTSNNITYGAFGEGMSYWSFFPTGDAGHGLHSGVGLRHRDRVALRRRGGRRALLRLLPDRRRGRAASGGRRRAALHRRRAAPPRAARRLQPVPALQQRPALPARRRRRARPVTGRCSRPRS